MAGAASADVAGAAGARGMAITAAALLPCGRQADARSVAACKQTGRCELTLLCWLLRSSTGMAVGMLA